MLRGKEWYRGWDAMLPDTKVFLQMRRAPNERDRRDSRNATGEMTGPGRSLTEYLYLVHSIRMS